MAIGPHDFLIPGARLGPSQRSFYRPTDAIQLASDWLGFNTNPAIC
jgi:hypothetical protein